MNLFLDSTCSFLSRFLCFSSFLTIVNVFGTAAFSFLSPKSLYPLVRPPAKNPQSTTCVRRASLRYTNSDSSLRVFVDMENGMVEFEAAKLGLQVCSVLFSSSILHGIEAQFLELTGKEVS